MTSKVISTELMFVLSAAAFVVMFWAQLSMRAATAAELDPPAKTGEKIAWQATSAGATRAMSSHFVSFGTTGQVAIGAGTSSHFSVQVGYWQNFESAVCACGDADANSIITISDAVFLINYIFAGGPPPNPACRGDADGNGIITISDGVYLINYIFAGGPAPQCQ